MPKIITEEIVHGRLESVIQALNGKLAEQGRLAQQIESLQKEKSLLESLADVVDRYGVPGGAETADDGEANLGSVEAAIAALRATGAPLLTRPLLGQMEKEGHRSAAKNPYMSVYRSLSRAASAGRSNLTKLSDGRWALREWEVGTLEKQGNGDE